MANHAEEMLLRGSALLSPLLLRHGFLFKVVDKGSSSGGHFASGEFNRGDRSLEFHFRHGLGMVKYRLADRPMTNRQYMCSVHGSLRKPLPEREFAGIIYVAYLLTSEHSFDCQQTAV